MVARAFIDDLRSLAFGSISAVYAAVGSPSDNRIRMISFSNSTEGDMIFSDDNASVAGKFFVKSGGFILWDIQANMNAQFDDKYVLPIGTQWYVKQLAAPVSGAVYISIFY